MDTDLPDTMDVLSSVTKISGLEVLLKQHSTAFALELGYLNVFLAAIKLNEGARPEFIKTCTLPYAMRLKVEEELTRLQTQGMIFSVRFSDCGKPRLSASIPDGYVRICVDYKRTINQVSILIRYL